MAQKIFGRAWTLPGMPFGYTTVMSLIDDNNNVSKRMWSYVRSKRTYHCGIVPLEQDGKKLLPQTTKQKF